MTTLAFSDLVARFGETEAVRTLEAIEALVMFQDNVERLRLAHAERLEMAMQKLETINFAA